MPRRPFIALTATVTALTLATTAGAMLLPTSGAIAPGGGSATAGTEPVFVVTGSGYGHGAGMSQYGAFAQANAGRSATDILAFYYPGTQRGRRTGTKLRVLLAQAATSLAISSPAPYTARDAAGQTYELPAGSVTLGPELQLPIDGVPTTVLGPLTITPATGSLISLGSRSYHGTLEVSSTGKALQAIDVVGLEAYVEGVVPGEVPGTWPVAALQAQAIAARSYALAARMKGKAWDLYSDGRSQQYHGAGSETPETTAAVKATAGAVLVYGGAVATTVYSSSSGGWTQSGLDAFGLDLPYLPAQDDPWDTASPFHAWQPRAYTARKLAKALGLRAPVTDVRVRFSPSARAMSITVTGADGSSLAVAGSEARRRLALRSTAFHLGMLCFLEPETSTGPGAPLRLNGVARDARRPALERLAPDGTWQTVIRRLQVSPTGTFAAVVRPTQTTTYRLSASGLPGPVLTIPVVGTLP